MYLLSLVQRYELDVARCTDKVWREFVGDVPRELVEMAKVQIETTGIDTFASEFRVAQDSGHAKKYVVIVAEAEI